MDRITKTEVDRSATRLSAFLERNRRERILEYPFGYAYPKNCCEGVSLILACLLEEKYRLDDVRVIRGSKPGGCEHHFWVAAGDWIYDLTAHQFEGRQPVIGAPAQEFSCDEFPERTLVADPGFVDRGAVVGLYRSGVIPF